MTEPNHRIERALERLGAEHEPPKGWEARVLEATRAQAQPKPKPRLFLIATPIAALVIAALVIYSWPSRSAAVAALSLEVETHKGSKVVLGESANLGDRLEIRAAGGDQHRALRIYNNDDLILACPGQPPCREDGSATSAELLLSSLGTYRIVALTSSATLPPSTSKYSQDVVAARQAGAIERTEILTVR